MSGKTRVRPSDSLRRLLSPPQRRALWELLEQRLSVTLPPLELPPSVIRFNLILTVVVVGLIILWLAGPLPRLAERRLGPWAPPVIILLFFAEVFFRPFSRLTLGPLYGRLRKEPPEVCRTVRQLAERLLQCPAVRREVEWTPELIAYALRMSLANYRLTAKEIRWDTPLTDIFGAERRPGCRYDLRAADDQCPECGLLIESRPLPAAVGALLAEPHRGPENLGRYCIYNIRRAFFNVGMVMIAAAGFLYALHFRVLAFLCALGGACGVLGELFDRSDFARPFLWRPIFCPDCDSALRVDRLGFGNDYALTCERCRVRYDAPAYHPPSVPAAHSSSEEPQRAQSTQRAQREEKEVDEEAKDR